MPGHKAASRVTSSLPPCQDLPQNHPGRAPHAQAELSWTAKERAVLATVTKPHVIL